MRSGKYYPAVKRNGEKVDEHRVILAEKLGRPIRPGYIAHHIDGNRQNNDPDNLEEKEDRLHRRDHRLGKRLSTETRQKISERHKGMPNTACRKLTENDVAIVFFLHEQHLTHRAIGIICGVSHSTVTNILNGKSYKNLTGGT